MKIAVAKRLVAFTACISVLFTFSLASFASAETPVTYIDPNTVITQDNIIDVMKYLGLDVDKLILAPQESGYSSLTVEELQQRVKEAKSQNAQEHETGYYSKDNGINLLSATPTYTKTLTTTTEYSAYKLTYSVNIQYEQLSAGLHIWEKFTR